jgi:hypothetical protein
MRYGKETELRSLPTKQSATQTRRRSEEGLAQGYCSMASESFYLNVVVENPPKSTSISVRNLDPVAAVLDHARLHLDQSQDHHVFKAPPGLLPPSDSGIAGFIKSFKLTGAEKLNEADKINKWFSPTSIDTEGVHILILRKPVNGTCHFLSLRLQSSH